MLIKKNLKEVLFPCNNYSEVWNKVFDSKKGRVFFLVSESFLISKERKEGSQRNKTKRIVRGELKPTRVRAKILIKRWYREWRIRRGSPIRRTSAGEKTRRGTRNEERARTAAKRDRRSKSSGMTSAARTAGAAAGGVAEARRDCRVAEVASDCAAPRDYRGPTATWTGFEAGRPGPRRGSPRCKEARRVFVPSPPARGARGTWGVSGGRPSRSPTPRPPLTRTAAPTATRWKDRAPRTPCEGPFKRSRYPRNGRGRRTSTRRRARNGYFAAPSPTRTWRAFQAYRPRGFQGTLSSNWRCPAPVKIPSVYTDKKGREIPIKNSRYMLDHVRFSLSLSLCLVPFSSRTRGNTIGPFLTIFYYLSLPGFYYFFNRGCFNSPPFF